MLARESFIRFVHDVTILTMKSLHYFELKRVAVVQSGDLRKQKYITDFTLNFIARLVHSI